VGTNIVFTPALQAPIGLMPSTGAVACVGNSSGGGAFAAVQPPQGALLFVTAAPSMALGVGTQAGAVGLAGQQAAVTQRAATLRNPAVGGGGLTGRATRRSVLGVPSTIRIRPTHRVAIRTP